MTAPAAPAMIEAEGLCKSYGDFEAVRGSTSSSARVRRDMARMMVEELSGGMKRRLTIARSLINQPDLLLLVSVAYLAATGTLGLLVARRRVGTLLLK